MKIFKGQGTSDLGKPWRYEEDGLTVIRGCAWSPPGCHPTGCGIKYLRERGRASWSRWRATRTTPSPTARLCVRCLTLPDYVYNPDRVLLPDEARPRGPRQADAWERISWDEAFDLIERRRLLHREVRRRVHRWSSPALAARAASSAAAPHRRYGTPNACYTPVGLRLLHSAPDRRPPTFWARPIPRSTTPAACRARYDDPAYRGCRSHRVLGQGPAAVQPRRPVRPCGH